MVYLTVCLTVCLPGGSTVCWIKSPSRGLKVRLIEGLKVCRIEGSEVGGGVCSKVDSSHFPPAPAREGGRCLRPQLSSPQSFMDLYEPGPYVQAGDLVSRKDVWRLRHECWDSQATNTPIHCQGKLITTGIRSIDALEPCRRVDQESI